MVEEVEKRVESQPKQTNVKISKGLVEALDKFLKTNLAREMGFRSRAEVVATAVREFLIRYGYYRSQGVEEERRE